MDLGRRRRLLHRALAPVSLLLLAASMLATGALSAAAQEAVAPGPTDAPAVDATLDAMSGSRRSLAAERGRRVIVLFYEDRSHIEDNDALKGELRRFVADNHLDDRVVLYGVANLRDVGSVPEMLVRQMIRPLVDRWGSDILLDWTGVMREAPFSFQTAAANVAIVDRSGRVVWRRVGTLDDAGRRDFYRALRAALAAR
jgi:hypothetical protein